MALSQPVESFDRNNRIFALCAGLLAVFTLVCAVFAVIAAWRWPLFGDVGIFHYIVSALRHGAKPYSEIKDFNFPGTYLLDAITMRLFGGGAVAERVYDLCLCLVAAAGFQLCLGSGAWARIAATIGAALLALIHLQDGLAQQGQRDFAMAALALLACGLYLRMERRPLFGLFLYQVLVGTIVTIKPTLVALFFAPLLLPAREDDDSTLLQRVGVSLAGFVLAPLVTACWLLKEHAGGAFLNMLATLGVIHSELARRSLAYLLAHCMSPIAALAAVWVVLIILERARWSFERRLLGLAAVCGFLSYWVQGKGFAYQRYPFLALLLALMFYDVSRVSKYCDGWKRFGAFVFLALAALWFCPKMSLLVRRIQPVSPFETALRSDLEQQGLRNHGSVQCLDTFSGCLTTVYEMGEMQSTGYLYDCYLYTAEGPARDRYRQQFLAALQQASPEVLVLSDQDCFHLKAGFGRVQRWPQLAALLNDRYTLAATWNSDERYLLWSRGETQPAFELYRRR